MTSIEEKQITADLSKFDNVGDMNTYLSNRYDFKQAKLGFISKPEYIKGIIKVLKTFNPPKK